MRPLTDSEINEIISSVIPNSEITEEDTPIAAVAPTIVEPVSLAEAREAASAIINEINERARATTGTLTGHSYNDNEPVVEAESDNIPRIPTNSETLNIDETTVRFSSALWYSKIQEKVVTLAGVGGIGSYTAFMLSRVHPKSIIIYDDDAVDTTNLSGQFYGSSEIGEFKATAISRMLQEYSTYYECFGRVEKFTDESEATDIMICGFDNMEARKIFFDKWQKHVNSLPKDKRKECLFIDGRLAAEEFQVLCIKGDDTYNRCRYAKDFLFSDEEADATICSYKQTSFCANMIASVMVNLFVNFVANQCGVIIDRDLPFYTEYNAERMFFKTEA